MSELTKTHFWSPLPSLLLLSLLQTLSNAFCVTFRGSQGLVLAPHDPPKGYLFVIYLLELRTPDKAVEV